jgi:serine/threonine-protein kinase
MASVMGTVGYMSPEQARGKHVDHRTDIWSLGVVLYEMLAGVPPFRSDNEQAVIYCLVNEEPEPIAKVRKDIPPALGYVVEKMLQKDRRNRYPDFASVIEDLKSVGITPNRIPDGFPKLKTTKLITSNRPRLAISVAIVIAVFCLGAIAFQFFKEPGTGHTPGPPVVGEISAPSIAVLPFEDLSPEQDQEFFCDGLSDELINALAHFSGLRVVARTSCFAFKGEKIDVREIGKRLNVATVLEGSVRRAGNSLRVNVQLVNVSDGYHMWGEKYERDIRDVFDLQDEISLAIADNLKVRLLDNEKTQLVRRHTESLEAYNLYLKGRWFWYKFTEEGFSKAVEYFQKAIEVDPNYAVAHAGLADAYGLMPGFTPRDPNDTFPMAKEAAVRALELDDTLAEAHSALAWIKMQYDWDFEEAEEEFLLALDLNPGLAHAYSEYGLFLMYMGRHDEAIEMTKKALEIDPVSLIINTNMIWTYENSGRYEEAIEAAHRTFEMDQRFPWSHHALGSVYFNMGMFEEAMQEFQKEVDRSDQWNQVMETQIGASYGVIGRVDMTQKSLETMLEKSEEQYVSPYFIANLYLAVGEVDKCFEYLDIAYEECDYFLLNLRNQLGTLVPLCYDPRMVALMEKMGFEKVPPPATAEAAALPGDV